MFAIVSMATSANSLIALCAISAFLEVSTLSNNELYLNFVDNTRSEYYTKRSKIHDDFINPYALNNMITIDKCMHDYKDKGEYNSKVIKGIINQSYFDKFATINLKFKEMHNLRKELKGMQDKRQFKKEKLDENSKKKILEYEETVKKWQNNFSVFPRSKRSANEFEKFISRVKNIIPKYLHKKVKPAVDKKRGKKDSTRSINRHHNAPHKARKSNQRHLTTTIRSKYNNPKHLSYLN